MMFSLDNCAAVVTSVVTRREMHGEDFKPAFNMNFRIKVDSKCIKGIVADTDSLFKSIWRIDDNEQVCREITKIHLESKFINGVVKIKEKYGHETVYENCKLESFILSPKLLRIAELTFKVQYTADKAEDVVDAFKSLCENDGVQVTIFADPIDEPVKSDSENQVDAFDKVDDDDPFAGSDLEQAGKDGESE